MSVTHNFRKGRLGYEQLFDLPSRFLDGNERGTHCRIVVVGGVDGANRPLLWP